MQLPYDYNKTTMRLTSNIHRNRCTLRVCFNNIATTIGLHFDYILTTIQIAATINRGQFPRGKTGTYSSFNYA